MGKSDFYSRINNVFIYPYYIIRKWRYCYLEW
nr:MAG TPA: hypothetical protein [Caudoviricetes sp.]